MSADVSEITSSEARRDDLRKTTRTWGAAGWILAVILAALVTSVSFATEEYAEKTGQPCGVCHRDPGGGGPLTPLGEAFGAGGHRWPVPEETRSRSLSAATKILRLILGFLHLTTGVVWLGTIFYVHLILRPKYALGGLPKSELRLAWMSIFLLGATGVPLTYLRFHNFHALVATHSGNLLLIKVALYLFLVLSAAFVTLFIGPRLRRAREQAGWQKNDGREGRPAWVRVGDRLYDVTESPRWKGGTHLRRHQAGRDLTADLGSAPHGPEKLERFPAFSVAEEGSGEGSSTAKVFYVIAYVNLFVALGVLVVISLWRWG